MAPETAREKDPDLSEDEVRSIVRDELNNEEATGGRREFLQALGLGGVAAGMGGGAGYAARGAVQPVRADHGGGSVGTDTNRVDVWADVVDANELRGVDSGGGIFEDTDGDGIYEQTTGSGVSVGRAVIGVDDPDEGPPYDLISNEDMTLVVDPNDSTAYDTIQGAVDDVPKLLRHECLIDVAPGTYDEDVVVRGVTNITATEGDTLLGGSSGSIDQGEPTAFQIVGDRDNPSNVSINSFTAISCYGVGNPQLMGAELTGSTPYFEDNASYMVTGSTEGFLANVNFVGSGAGVLAYTSRMHLRRCDFSGNIDTAIFGKRMAKVDAYNCTGSVPTAVLAKLGSHMETRGSSFVDGDVSIETGSTAFLRNERVVYPNYEEYVKPTTARVTGSADQTLDSSASTKIAFDTAEYDAGGQYDTATYEYTAPVTGVYDISASLQFLNISGGTRITVKVADSNGSLAESQHYPNGGDPSVEVSTKIKLQEGDVVWIEGAHTEGSARDANLDFTPLSRATFALDELL